MKSVPIVMLGGLLAVASGAAIAAPGTTNQVAAKRVLSVLVHVNSNGTVTGISPSATLSPRLRRMLDNNLKEMIVKPAMYHGRTVASQFVMNVKLDASARSEGDYDAKFAYVSSQPVPPGSYYWFVDKESGRLALVNASMRNLDPFSRRHINLPPPPGSGYPRGQMPSQPVQPAPPTQPTPPTQNQSMAFQPVQVSAQRFEASR